MHGHKHPLATTQDQKRGRPGEAAGSKIRRSPLALRMLCTECLHVGEPDTVLEGSDRIEFLAWCCFALPGLVYCWWRHLCRFKVCPECGSDALMRESRAAAARRAPQARPVGGSRIRSLEGLGFVWPRPLGSPRERLRSGSITSLLLLLGCSAWLLGALDLTSEAHALQGASAGGLLCISWLLRQIHQIARLRGAVTGCEAWDQQGRALRIERA
jgi:hypothetical protein